MYHARFKGTHYEAGFKYGSTLRAHGVIINGSPTFKITEEMKRFASDCMSLYERHYPDVLQELHGMADGQRISFELLCQIIFSIYCFKHDNHCTCFAIADSSNIIFGRNSDFLVSIEKLYMNCLYSLDGAYAFNGNTTAFIQMEDGMNEHGLAVGLTFVYPHMSAPGLNAGILVRYLLEKCKTTDEAIRVLKALPTASAQTITIADSKGEIAVVESNSKKCVVVRPQEGENFVATANNFNSEEMKGFRTPKGVDDWRSDERYATAKTALESNTGNYSTDFSKRLLAGEYGFMCQYDRRKNADTVWSVVYDIRNMRIYRVEGNPSRKTFKEDSRMKFKP